MTDASACPVAGCDRHLAPAKPLCRLHWFQTPPNLQQQILAMQKHMLYSTQDDLWLEEEYEALVDGVVELLSPNEAS
jgi:hypothetical protein